MGVFQLIREGGMTDTQWERYQSAEQAIYLDYQDAMRIRRDVETPLFDKTEEATKQYCVSMVHPYNRQMTYWVEYEHIHTLLDMVSEKFPRTEERLRLPSRPCQYKIMHQPWNNPHVVAKSDDESIQRFNLEQFIIGDNRVLEPPQVCIQYETAEHRSQGEAEEPGGNGD